MRPFFDATKKLERNGEVDDYAGTRGSLWEVFPWIDGMGRRINAAMEAVPDDEVELQFYQSRILRQDKLNGYSLMLTRDTSYYYAAIVLHPSLQLLWSMSAECERDFAEFERLITDDCKS